MSREKHNTLQDCVKAVKETFITKAEHESSEEKFHKQQQEINEKLLMVQEDLNNIKVLKSIWLIRILAKNFDPEVLSRVKQEDLYDPVQVLKRESESNTGEPDEGGVDHEAQGFITTEELRDLLLFLGKRYSESVLKDIITKADVDLNRGVDFTQFLKIMENKDNDEELETALKLIDNDDVGCVPGSQTCAVGKPRREAPGESLRTCCL
ncbi:calmodulin-like [Panicum miliaceum]|uniref:Calmodulin-like n=1 Tax=Panicum miliaceum TaxID=4540 RepID=A0A3L6PQ17_PANMI|nr:calmodulin-like [Panicum miliaceum]